MYLKITNAEENHHGLQYHDGLVIDPVPFSKKGSCCPGGIYFTTPEYICNFLYIGIYIREVTIPEDSETVQDPDGNKWRASKVILSPRKELWNVNTWKWLVEIGVDIHLGYDIAFRLASYNGHIEVVKCLVENGADIHSCNDEALRWSSRNGCIEVVKHLIEYGANIHSINDDALRWASRNGHFEVVKYLVEYGAHICDETLKLAYENGYIEIVSFLKETNHE